MLRFKTSMRSDKDISTTEKCLGDCFHCFVSYANVMPATHTVILSTQTMTIWAWQSRGYSGACS